MRRRKFIQAAGISFVGMAGGLNALSDQWLKAEKSKSVKLTILHTNDVHSRMEPFPMDGSRNEGLGGAARRASLISDIRKSEKNVLLLDAGDMFQGTPYFNYFLGEPEIKMMNAMKYDVATIGNHDFDGGLENLETQLNKANFTIVNANYHFTGNGLASLIKPYTVIEKEGIRVGIFGLGIELEGLVPAKLYGNTQYQDPVAKAREISEILKSEEKCDYIICLSHLGHKYKDEKISDVELASKTSNIDLIIGGHTHTFLDKPMIVNNPDGMPVHVTQAGWGGIMLGRIDVTFEKSNRHVCTTCDNIYVGRNIK
jgi:5'-nucleotidase